MLHKASLLQASQGTESVTVSNHSSLSSNQSSVCNKCINAKKSAVDTSHKALDGSLELPSGSRACSGPGCSDFILFFSPTFSSADCSQSNSLLL